MTQAALAPPASVPPVALDLDDDGEPDDESERRRHIAEILGAIMAAAWNSRSVKPPKGPSS